MKNKLIYSIDLLPSNLPIEAPKYCDIQHVDNQNQKVPTPPRSPLLCVIDSVSTNIYIAFDEV